MIQKAKDIKTILIIGNGRMGTDISCQCALFEKDVRIFVGIENPSEELGPFLKRQRDYFKMLIGKGMVSEERVKSAAARVTFDDDIERICEDVDLVSESVLESIPIKQTIWKRFAPYLPKDAILTSNTSSLITSSYADASGAPERFLAWHFHTPVYIQNYVDIMPHPGTDPSYVPIIAEFSKSIGLDYGILKKETPNYLANNMLIAVIDMAFHLWIQGYASYQDIDKAWMSVRVYPIGPFGICDKVGIPALRHIYAARENQTDEIKEIISRLDKMIAEGKTGLEAQKGFYEYPNAEFLQDDFVARAKPLL